MLYVPGCKFVIVSVEAPVSHKKVMGGAPPVTTAEALPLFWLQVASVLKSASIKLELPLIVKLIVVLQLFAS